MAVRWQNVFKFGREKGRPSIVGSILALMPWLGCIIRHRDKFGGGGGRWRPTSKIRVRLHHLPNALLFAQHVLFGWHPADVIRSIAPIIRLFLFNKRMKYIKRGPAVRRGARHLQPPHRVECFILLTDSSNFHSKEEEKRNKPFLFFWKKKRRDINVFVARKNEAIEQNRRKGKLESLRESRTAVDVCRSCRNDPRHQSPLKKKKQTVKVSQTAKMNLRPTMPWLKFEVASLSPDAQISTTSNSMACRYVHCRSAHHLPESHYIFFSTKNKKENVFEKTSSRMGIECSRYKHIFLKKGGGGWN